MPLKSYTNKGANTHNWGLTPQIKLPTGSSSDDYALSDGSVALGLSLSYSAEGYPFENHRNWKLYQLYDLFYWENRQGDDGMQEGDVIARMYLPPNRELAEKSHIHFNLIGGRNHRFRASAMFSDEIVQEFHATWGRFGTDGDRKIPPCMGYRLAPEENPFGTGEKESL